jgi:hypothetical protein
VIRFETLENRQLFSVFPNAIGVILPGTGTIGPVIVTEDSINLNRRDETFVSNGELFVNGNDNNDTLLVRYNQGPVVAQFSALLGPGAAAGTTVGPLGPSFDVYRGGVKTHSFSTNGVTKITLVGYGGADTLSVDSSVRVPVRALGGDGADYIVGGSGPDNLQGGRDTDTIMGNAGNDAIGTGGTTAGEEKVYAGDGDDNVSGGSGQDRIEGNAGNDTVNGMAGNDTILGGDGNDNLSGGDGDDWIDGGAGDDTIYGQVGNDSLFAGLGTDKLFGGGQQDTLVSVFGGSDTLSGDGDWDIFVADKVGDTLFDADNLATQRGSVYRIGRFSNPTVAGTNPVFATELGAVNITDPAVVSPATRHASFSTIPLFTAGGPRMTDVAQGQLGNCWLSATAASVARSTPWAIKRSVVPLGDGTFMVAMGDKTFRLDADLAVNANGTAIYSTPFRPGGSSLWYPLLEKAAAYYMYKPKRLSNGQPIPGLHYTYADSVGDFIGTAYNALRVGYDRHTLAEVPILGIGTGTDEAWSHIVRGVNLGKAVVVATEPGFLGVGSALAPSHAYSVIGYKVTSSGQRQVVLRNPWGHNGSRPSSGPDGEVTVGVGNQHDSCIFLYVAK